jgi:hypothetical protein
MAPFGPSEVAVTAAAISPGTGRAYGVARVRDPGRFGSFTLDGEGHRKVWARLRVLDGSDCPQTGAAAGAGEWPAIAAPSSAAP